MTAGGSDSNAAIAAAREAVASRDSAREDAAAALAAARDAARSTFEAAEAAATADDIFAVAYSADQARSAAIECAVSATSDRPALECGPVRVSPLRAGRARYCASAPSESDCDRWISSSVMQAQVLRPSLAISARSSASVVDASYAWALISAV